MFCNIFALQIEHLPKFIETYLKASISKVINRLKQGEGASVSTFSEWGIHNHTVTADSCKLRCQNEGPLLLTNTRPASPQYNSISRILDVISHFITFGTINMQSMENSGSGGPHPLIFNYFNQFVLTIENSTFMTSSFDI